MKSYTLNDIYYLFWSYFYYGSAMEYIDSPLTFNNGTCGSIFYMLTGFHGIHVLIGTIFLIVTLIRIYKGHLLVERHILLEVSSLY
jgi:cytochrome c oxidase subunit 3